MIREKRFKVWVDPDKQITQLYDLKNDPLEKQNLLGTDDTAALAALQRMQAVVDATPDGDARPQYRKRQPLPWDKQVREDTQKKPRKEKRNKRRSN